jgi:glycosyltransferase involved in cell wall biosynthesis
MLGFRRLIKASNEGDRIHFVFVSDWMRIVAEQDSLLKVKNFSIIPNPINLKLFSYQQKLPGHRKKILILRSFNSRKYANDISVEAILQLSKKPFFEELRIAIYGKGKDFTVLTAPLKKFSNIELHERYISNVEIPEIHKHYGAFMCPTRQDAQGVSMCEAMSSGLVPLTSYSTAIPEFVEDNETGLLTSNSAELAEAVEKIYKDTELFQRLSKQASEFIGRKCSIDQIVKQELSILNFS